MGVGEEAGGSRVAVVRTVRPGHPAASAGPVAKGRLGREAEGAVEAEEEARQGGRRGEAGRWAAEVEAAGEGAAGRPACRAGGRRATGQEPRAARWEAEETEEGGAEGEGEEGVRLVEAAGVGSEEGEGEEAAGAGMACGSRSLTAKARCSPTATFS